ncbi:MAG TPA: hypothetical protein VFS12_08995 [Terriglobia bacterium]|nr:hypothetical protein [Terriglobia bacterium]
MKLARIPQPALGHQGNRQHGEVVRVTVTVLRQGSVELAESPHYRWSINWLIAVPFHVRYGTLIGQTDCLRFDLLARPASRQSWSVGALAVNSDSCSAGLLN